ncbi:hypothetical protein GCM10007385_34500 [Tateyamaria omphalii]|uniref:DUF4198 domain-containing protein n=1 Tax=Tateyamaria omphalii TaxID=299262 RepID=UPI0016763DB8|nr:DUF4198 domain-containing protein [Tateyamaria omphalii]GGX62469.1 hypothetical protein GCM10007385_34500 [Tateyamaria omphalii]
MYLFRLLTLLWCAILTTSATAHEFWIEPEQYQVPSSGQIVARLKNGEAFEGVNLAYFERRIARFDVVVGDTIRPVEARMGDNPALDVPAPVGGLVVVVHETTSSSLTYKEWAKFQKFADHKDFADIEAQHAANGFPAPPFKERYTRHAKALIAVGEGAGADRALGLKTEFIALTNPYAADFDGTMQVQVTLDGAIRADAQVEVFDRAPDDSVTITLHRTDADGIAAIPVTPGHEYLFDAVSIAPITDSDDAVWDTYWAALTFAVPE